MGTGLYSGTAPETVLLSLTSSNVGEHLVQMITEFAYGSPDATPWVKLRFEGA